MNLQYKKITASVKAVENTNNTVHAIFSTADIDRHGEIVDQKSWILDEYLTNPVVLFSHNHDEPAIGKVNNIEINADGNLEGDVQFAVDEYDFAKTIYNLYVGGYMRAFSVGFMSNEADVSGDNVVLKGNTLFELSAVNVPANAMALAKQKGIDTAPLERKQKEAAKETPKKEEPKEVVVEQPKPEVVNPGGTPEIAVDQPAEIVVEPKDKTKGAVADAITAEDDAEAKYQWLDPVYEILGAFYDLIYSTDTKVEQLPALLKETATLLMQVADGTYVETDEPTDEETTTDEPVDTPVQNAMKKLDKEAKEKLFSKFKKTDGTLDIKSLVGEIEKAGKVLSTTNHNMIKESVKAMTKVLEANGEPTCPGCGGLHNPATCTGSVTVEASASTDITKAAETKVETPVVRAASSEKKNSAREINKAIRALLAQKRKV